MERTVRKREGYPWVILVLLFAMTFVFTGIVMNNLSMYIAPVTSEFSDISRTAYAVSLTLVSAINAVVSVFYGKICEKIGTRAIIGIGAAFAAVGILLYAFAQLLIVFYIGASLVGVAIAFTTTIPMSSGVNTWFAKRMGTMYSIVATAGGIGGAIFGPVIGTWIETVGWRQSQINTVFIVVAVGVLLVLFYRNKPEDVGIKPMWSDDKKADMQQSVAASVEKAADEAPGMTLKEALKAPRFWTLNISFFLMGMIFNSFLTNMSIFTTTQGYDSVAAGLVLTIVFAANTIVTIPAGLLSDKYGTKSVVGIVCALFIVGCIILMQPGIPYWLICIAGVIAGCGYMVLIVPMPIAIKEVFGNKSYTAIVGVSSAILVAGVAIGTPIVQLGYDLTGSYNTVFAIYIIVAAVCFVMYMLTLRKKKAV